MNSKVTEYLDKFAALPKGQKIGIAAGFYIVILIVFFQFFFVPNNEKVNELTEKIEDIDVQIAEKRRIVRNLPSFEEEVKKLDQKLDRVLLELPDSKEVDAFLKSISVLASDTGLEVTKFTPRAEVTKGFFSELPVNIELQGTFHELVTFFYELSHLPRIVNVDGIQIVILRESPSTVLIKASCRATTFRYLEGGTDNKKSREDPSKPKRRPA